MVKTFVFLLSVVLAAPAVLAQAGPPPPPPDDAQPVAPPPESQPPPPPAAAPPTSQPIEPPQATGNTSAAPSSVPGEWVYTTPYGWVWMPYDQQYTHVVETSGVAYMFVFYPGFGWRWVLSPWVFGLGPRPHFAHGPGRFAWYARPWFRAHPLVRRKVVRTHRR